jgi:hypothetical protein
LRLRRRAPDERLLVLLGGNPRGRPGPMEQTQQLAGVLARAGAEVEGRFTVAAPPATRLEGLAKLGIEVVHQPRHSFGDVVAHGADFVDG